MAQHEMDIDFENYKVEPVRAESIRARINQLREKSWVEQIVTVVNEMGEVDQAAVEEESNGMRRLPGFEKKESLPKVYRPMADTPADGLTLSVSGPEVKVKFWDRCLLELSLFPRSSDYVVYNLDSQYWDLLEALMEEIEPSFKAAKSKKTGRQAEWKARFAASEANA